MYDQVLENVWSVIVIQSLFVYQQLEGDIFFVKQDYVGVFVSYDKVNQIELVFFVFFFSVVKVKELSKVVFEEVIVLLDSCIVCCQIFIIFDLVFYLLECVQMYMNVEKYCLVLVDYDVYFNVVKGSVNDLFYYYCEQVVFKVKQFQCVLDDIVKVIEFNLEDFIYCVEQVVVNFCVGCYEEVEKVLKDVLVIDLKYVEGYCLLGICQIQLK